MLLIVGLGNPGKEYEKTRHNAGWLFLDYLKSLPESEFEMWKKKKKLSALVSEGTIHLPTFPPSHLPTRIALAKPLTFMNDSGLAVQKLTNHYSLTTNHLIIAHDDIDIPFGEFKIQTNRGPAGHHGVESIIEHLGTKDFTRVRIGIRPSDNARASANTQSLKAMDHVLKRFSKTEQAALETVFKTITSQLSISKP